MARDHEVSTKAPAARSIDTITQAITLATYESSGLPLQPVTSEKAATLVAHQLGKLSRPTFATEFNEDGTKKGWQDFSNCLGVDQDLFFPERGHSTREAKEVCQECVVREDCLEYALANGKKFGIWGGLSERERRRIRRQRAIERRSAASTTASSEVSSS